MLHLVADAAYQHGEVKHADPRPLEHRYHLQHAVPVVERVAPAPGAGAEVLDRGSCELNCALESARARPLESSESAPEAAPAAMGPHAQWNPPTHF